MNRLEDLQQEILGTLKANVKASALEYQDLNLAFAAGEIFVSVQDHDHYVILRIMTHNDHYQQQYKSIDELINTMDQLITLRTLKALLFTAIRVKQQGIESLVKILSS